MELHTILGGNGTMARAIAPILQVNNKKFRQVSRNPKSIFGGEVFTADLLNRDQVFEAVRGSSVVYLMAGLQYSFKIWRNSWPVIMRNTIDACKATGAKLIFFDNVYMYGRVQGKMTEETALQPSSNKGRIRLEIADMLLREIKEGKLKALIARSADFYGPDAKEISIPGVLVFEKMKKAKTAQWFSNADQPHSFTYTPDAAEAVYQLAITESAFGQVWHLPTAAPALSGKQFITLAAKYMNAGSKVQVLPSWLIKMIGWFNPFMKELGEMLYQYEYPYRFDSTKFENEFAVKPTSYEEGIKATSMWFLGSESEVQKK